MMHRNAQTLGDAIREFFEDNAELRGKILEIRVMRAWGEILGPPRSGTPRQEAAAVRRSPHGALPFSCFSDGR